MTLDIKYVPTGHYQEFSTEVFYEFLYQGASEYQKSNFGFRNLLNEIGLFGTFDFKNYLNAEAP